MKKRSITLKGHATSITLEDEFWFILKQIATDKNKSIATIVNEIDERRLRDKPETGLSSAIRVYVLNSIIARADQTTRG